MYRIDKTSQALQRSINIACWWQCFRSKVIHNQSAGPVSLRLETAVCKSSRKRKTCRSRFTGHQVTWRRDLGQRGTSGSVLSSLVLTCNSKKEERLFHHITPWIQDIYYNANNWLHLIFLMGLLKTHFAILDSLFFDFLLLNTDGVLKVDIQNVYCNVFMNANSK